MTVLNTLSQNDSLMSSATLLLSVLRLSNCVMTIPPMFRFGFKRVLTISTTFVIFAIPRMARNCACTGIIRKSADVRAFSVSKPSEGGQSIRI